jgi:hypothetical protein
VLKFGSFPQSISIINGNSNDIRNYLFSGRWKMVQNAYRIVFIPFFLFIYCYLIYHLLVFSRDSIFESILSLLIIFYGLYFVLTFVRALYIGWTFENSRKRPSIKPT